MLPMLIHLLVLNYTVITTWALCSVKYAAIFNKLNALLWLIVPDWFVCFIHMSKYPTGKFCLEIFCLPAVIEWIWTGRDSWVLFWSWFVGTQGIGRVGKRSCASWVSSNEEKALLPWLFCISTINAAIEPIQIVVCSLCFYKRRLVYLGIVFFWNIMSCCIKHNFPGQPPSFNRKILRSAGRKPRSPYNNQGITCYWKFFHGNIHTIIKTTANKTKTSSMTAEASSWENLNLNLTTFRELQILLVLVFCSGLDV